MSEDNASINLESEKAAALMAALMIQKSVTPQGQPFSVRFSEATSRSIEAEARLTRRTASAVIRDRMIFGLTPGKERDPYLRDRRRLMPVIVEMSDECLRDRAGFVRGLIERAQSPRPHLEDELRLYETELALRAEEGRHDEEVARARLLNAFVAEKIQRDERHYGEG